VGFKPTRSIYFAIGFDEENGGRQGAKQEAEYFKSQGLQFECMMDEGLFYRLKDCFRACRDTMD